MTDNQSIKGTHEVCLQATKSTDSFEIMGIGAILVGNDLRIASFNGTAKEIVGLTLHDLERPLTETNLNVKFSNLRQCLESAIHSRAVTEREFKDNLDRWHLARICPNTTKDGKVDGGVVTLFNVDRLKHAQAEEIGECKRLEESWRKRVEELTSADRDKDEFLAHLVHELRNPLAPMLNSMALLKRAGHDQTITQRAIEIIDRQLETMVQLVDDLLDVTRLKRGAVNLEKKPCDLRAIVTRTAQKFRRSCEAQNQKLVLSFSEEPAILDADANRLEQVIGNLLTNASQFAKAGGKIELTMQHSENRAGEVSVSVRHDGLGIAPDMLPRVFDPFGPGERMSEGAQGSLRIGLALARSLTELHGGAIEVHSQGIDWGSEFRVFLPLSPKAQDIVALNQGESSAKGQCRGPLQLLVVDDNVDVAETLAMLLRDAGHQVSVVHSGMAALEAAAAKPPQAVLLDIGLPGMDGYEVASKMRQLPGLNKVLLVALTGQCQEKDRTRAKEAGFDFHLTKPTTLKALEESLAQLQRA